MLTTFVLSIGLLFLFGISAFSFPFFLLCGALCFLMLLSTKHLECNMSTFAGAPSIILFIFIFSTLFSLLYTHSVPLSLQYLFIQMFMVLVFIYILLLRQSYLPFELTLHGLLIVPTALTLVSAVCFFVPGLGSLLPPTNVLYPTYGHNHLNALLLLLYPLAWLFAVRIRSVYAWFIVSIFTVGFIISFGRTALWIAVLQVAALFVYFSFYTKQGLPKNILFRMSGAVILCLIIFTLLMLPTTHTLTAFKQEYLCSGQVPMKVQQLMCKDMLLENRVLYWKQAIRAFFDYPLYGYGPGTFGLISTKYRQLPQLKTLYAHNGFLEIFAQSGLIAGVTWLGFWCAVVIQGSRSVRKYEDTAIREQKSALLLGVVGILCNCFFDYDWQVFPTLILSTICAALLLKEQTRPQTVQKDQCWLRKTYVVLGFLVLIFVLINVASETAAYFGFTKLAFSLNPYSQSLKDTFFESNSLSIEDKKWLAYLYRFHGEKFGTFENYFGDDAQFSRNLLESDYWQYHDHLIQKHPTEADLAEYEKKTAEQMEIMRADGVADDWRLEQMSEYLIRVIDRYARDNMRQQAIQIYTLSAKIWPLTLHKALPPVTSPQISQADCEMLKELTVHKDYEFGQNQHAFAGWYRDCMQLFPQEFMTQDFFSKIHDLDGTMGHDYWRQVSTSFFHEISKAQKSGMSAQAVTYAQQWYTLWLVTEKEQWDVSRDTKELLYISLLSTGLEEKALVVQRTYSP